VLVSTGLILVHFNCLEEGTSLLHYFLILHRNHLVEIYGLPVIPDRRLLVDKSDLPRAEGLQVVSSA